MSFSLLLLLRQMSFAAVFTSIALHARAADQCPGAAGKPNVDLRKEFGPTRDQGNIGWCYSYGSADLLGHWVQKKTGVRRDQPGQMISATAGALDNNRFMRSATYGAAEGQRRVYASTALLAKEAGQKFAKAQAETHARAERIMKTNPRAGELKVILQKEYDDQIAKFKAMAATGKSSYGSYGSEKAKATPTLLKPELFETMYLTETGQQAAAELQKIMAADPVLAESMKKRITASSELTYYLSIKPTPLPEPEGGQPKLVLESMIDRGYCLEADVPSEGFDFKAKTAPPTYGIGFYPMQTPQDGVGAILHDGLSKYHLEPTKQNLCAALAGASQMFPKLNQETIRQVLVTSLKKEEDATDRLLEKACHRQTFPNGKPKAIEHKGDEAFAELRKVLDRGEPVGITYDASILKMPSGDIVEKGLGNHYSVLVGERFNCATGEMEYILRNSWGPKACEAAHDQVEAMGLFRNVTPELQAAVKDCKTSCAGKGDECLETCSMTAARAQPGAAEAAKVDYHCDAEHFVVSESLLKKGLASETHLE